VSVVGNGDCVEATVRLGELMRKYTSFGWSECHAGV
jgi:hypothetical protein